MRQLSPLRLGRGHCHDSQPGQCHCGNHSLGSLLERSSKQDT
jgi:hypothetical protein